MNNHRMLPLIFTFSFAAFAPLLALGERANQPLPARPTVSRLLNRMDRTVEATWLQWHEKSQVYAELANSDQR